MYRKYFKRLFDIVCSLFALIVFFWLYLLIAVLVRIKLGSPVVYSATRIGLNNKPFKLYKFRSMNDKKDENGNLLPDSERLTSFGRKLRATSLDEILEVINILKGDMSIIGPRPLPDIYLPYYTDEEIHRHDVRPGLTGLAQINGRNAISWENKFKYDLFYVKNISFIFDIKILVKTVLKVFIREGIGQAEEAPVSLHVLRKGMKNEHYR